jgi:hypothetical protein
MAWLFRLSDEVWVALEPHLPKELSGKPCADDRVAISGISHALKADTEGGTSQRIRPAHDGLKSLPSLGTSSRLAEDLREDGGGWGRRPF